MFKNEHYCSDLEIKGVAQFMLFHSLRTKVLRSLHNNTQQPVIYLVKGKSVVAPVVLIWEKTDKGGLSLITRTTPTKQHTCLQNSVAKWVDWNCLSSAESFINARSRLQPASRQKTCPWWAERYQKCVFNLQAGCKHTYSFLIAPPVRSSLW